MCSTNENKKKNKKFRRTRNGENVVHEICESEGHQDRGFRRTQGVTSSVTRKSCVL